MGQKVAVVIKSSFLCASVVKYLLQKKHFIPSTPTTWYFIFYVPKKFLGWVFEAQKEKRRNFWPENSITFPTFTKARSVLKNMNCK